MSKKSKHKIILIGGIRYYPIVFLSYHRNLPAASPEILLFPCLRAAQPKESRLPGSAA